MRRGLTIFLALGAALVGAGALQADAAVPITGVVSQSPATGTPNVSAGTTNSATCLQWFGSGGCSKAAVWTTTIVNGEVIVGGGFTEANGATYNDILAYNVTTGAIDTGFAPQLNQGPVYSLVPGPNNTVIVGGAFTQVDGAAHEGIVALTVDPGSSDDGAIVTGFNATVAGLVRGMAISGNALYVGGKFSRVDKTAEQGIARLNATTGAIDTTFGQSVSTPVWSGDPVKVYAVAVNAAGTQIAIAGSFLNVDGQPTPRLAVINTGGGLGDPGSLDNWYVGLMTNNCSAEHDYARDVDFSPDGSYLAIGDTGYQASPGNAPSLCDSVARIPVAGVSGDVTPTWIDYTGGDSPYSVQVTNSAIYFGGHFRWLDNECGNNVVCEPNAVLVQGLGAVDPNTGLAIPWWHPMTERGNGTMSLETFGDNEGVADGGLIIGNNSQYNGGVAHGFNAMFPLTSTGATPTFGSIPSGLWSQGDIGGSDEGVAGAGTPYECLTDASGVAQLGTCDNDPSQNWTDSAGVLSIGSNCLTGGLAVTVTACGLPEQTWTQGTGNTLIDGVTGECVTDPGRSTTVGTALTEAPCDGDQGQVWPVPAAPMPASLTPVGPLSSAALRSDTQPGCITSAATVDMTQCIGFSDQKATINSTGTITIAGKCLDLASGGTQVVADKCNSSQSQVWTPTTGYRLTNASDGLCLAINAHSDSQAAPLDVTTCTSSNLEQWRLPAV
jgi:ricin-type beta-trefoil lectin protein/beta-propeller uncharacterized protein DUF5122